MLPKRVLAAAALLAALAALGIPADLIAQQAGANIGLGISPVGAVAPQGNLASRPTCSQTNQGNFWQITSGPLDQCSCSGSTCSWVIVPGTYAVYYLGTDQDTYVRSDGSDTTCDGTTNASAAAGAATGACAYATVERAVQDVNASPAWTSTMHVNVQGLTDGSQHIWRVVTFPNPQALSGGTAMFSIEGACASPLVTWAGSVTRGAIANKGSYGTYPVGAWVGTVTDGSHWVKNVSGGRPSGTTSTVTRTSTSPNLIAMATGNFAAGGSLCSYETTFNGTVEISGPTGAQFQGGNGPPIRVIGISFTSASFNYANVRFAGSRIAGSNGPSFIDVDLRGVYLGVTSATTFEGRAFRNNALSVLVNGAPFVVRENIGNLQADAFTGTTVTAGLIIGGDPTSTLVPSVDGLFATMLNFGNNDFEETGGDGVWCIGSQIANTNSQNVNFAITGGGRALYMQGNCTMNLQQGAQTWQGTATAASIVTNGSTLTGRFNVTNSGSDVTVGSGSSAVTYAVGNTFCVVDPNTGARWAPLGVSC